jgi:hypothetical protein
VGDSSIRAARAAGQFPASWFDMLEVECRAKGIECPRELFAFKRPNAPQDQQRGAA